MSAVTQLFYVRGGPSLCSAAVIRNMAFETVAFRREILTFKGIETMVKVGTVDLITGMASFRNYWAMCQVLSFMVVGIEGLHCTEVSGDWNRVVSSFLGIGSTVYRRCLRLRGNGGVLSSVIYPASIPAGGDSQSRCCSSSSRWSSKPDSDGDSEGRSGQERSFRGGNE